MCKFLLCFLILALSPLGCIKSAKPLDPNFTIFEITKPVPSVQWVFSKKDLPLRYSNQLAIGKDKVFFSTQDGAFYAINKANGEKLWVYESEGFTQFLRNIIAVPIVTEVVYFASSDSYLYALEAHNGKLLWKHQTETSSSMVSTPLIYQNTLYFANDKGIIHAIELSSGKKQWSLDLKHHLPPSNSEILWIYGFSMHEGSLLISNDRADILLAVDAVTGKEVRVLNNAPLENELSFWFPPFLANGVAYYAFFTQATAISEIEEHNFDLENFLENTNLVAYHLSDQSKLWEYTTVERPTSSPVLSGNYIIIPAYEFWDPGQKETEAYLYAIDARNGKEQWRKAFDSTIFNLNAINGYIFFSTKNILYCLEAETGTKLWKYDALHEIYEINSIAIDQNFIFFSNEKNIYAIKLK